MNDDRFKHETRVIVVSISIWISLYMYLYRALLRLCETTSFFRCLLNSNINIEKTYSLRMVRDRLKSYVCGNPSSHWLSSWLTLKELLCDTKNTHFSWRTASNPERARGPHFSQLLTT